MLKRYVAPLLLLMLSVPTVAADGEPAAPLVRVPAGQVRFYNIADSDFDVYSKAPSDAIKSWMRERYTRMQTYSPYFDKRLAWYPNAWVYKDSYAIKPHWSEFRDHPEWVLRGVNGELLYIPWGCDEGTCPQYAGDFGNPAFRRHWIAEARELIAKGYRGLWIDDVNLTWRVSDGHGRHARPIDPRTGELMTLQDWRRYFAEFMDEIRAALPDIEIAHNAIWYAGPVDDPFIRRQIEAADYYNLERGATDKGLRPGRGRWGLETFLEFIDHLHARGKSVVLMNSGNTVRQREYGLAAWLLISSGNDLISSNQLRWTSPDSWWLGYQLNLGQARSDRYEWRGLLRRDFACGFVLLNQPRRPRIYIRFATKLTRIGGQAVTSVTLRDASAAILITGCD